MGPVISTILFPVLFLASMGLGLGTLVDSSTSGGVEGHSYLVFLAPGLLAATAMQTAVGESTYPVMGAIKWVKTYHAMLATPLGVARRARRPPALHRRPGADRLDDLPRGDDRVRGRRRPLALFALPAALLTGLAFATPVVAYSAVLRERLRLRRAVPVRRRAAVPVRRRVLPGDAAAAGAGAAGVRSPRSGTASSCPASSRSAPRRAGSTLLHVAYLAVWIVVGFAFAVRNYQRRLAV